MEPRDEAEHGSDDFDADELLVSDGARLLHSIATFLTVDETEEAKELRKEGRDMGVTLARLVSEKAEVARTLVPDLEDGDDGKETGSDPRPDKMDRAPGTPPAPPSGES